MVVAAAGQGVDIEKVLTIQRDAADKTVVERLLNDVGIFTFAAELQQAVIPHDQRNRGAGFGIGGLIGQIVIGGKAFVMTRGANAAGEIHALVDQVLPQPFAGFQQRRVVEFMR